MNTVPQVLDPFVRAVRTALQVLLAAASLVLVLSTIWPQIVVAIRAEDGSTVSAFLGGSVVWLTAAAGIIARIMAIPGVNQLLGKIGLAGHSGEATGNSDTFTRFVPVQTPDTPTDSQH